MFWLKAKVKISCYGNGGLIVIEKEPNERYIILVYDTVKLMRVM